MMESIYDFCLFYTNGNDKGFRVVDLQTEDIFILANNIFAAVKKKELKEAKLLAKNREKLILHTPIKFNWHYIRLADNNNLFLNQKRQCQCLRLIIVKESIDLVNSRGKIKKVVISKNQYVVQQACGAYIVTVSQPEAAFDLSFVAKVNNSKKKMPKH